MILLDKRIYPTALSRGVDTLTIVGIYHGTLFYDTDVTSTASPLISCSDDTKVFYIPTDDGILTIGIAGDLLLANQIKDACSSHKSLNHIDMISFISDTVFDNKSLAGGELMIITPNNVVYAVDYSGAYFQVIEPIHVIGQFSSYALGVLHCMESKDTNRSGLLDALDIIKSRCCYRNITTIKGWNPK